MDIKTPVIIFSVARTSRTTVDNYDRHRAALHRLDTACVSHREGQGAYKGGAERCIMAILYDKRTENIVRTIAEFNEQESVLYVDTERHARLETPNGELIRSLGKFTDAPRDVAVQKDSYMLINGRYWITIPISNAERNEQRLKYERALVKLAAYTLDILTGAKSGDWRVDIAVGEYIGDRALNLGLIREDSQGYSHLVDAESF